MSAAQLIEFMNSVPMRFVLGVLFIVLGCIYIAGAITESSPPPPQ